jgi:hypothetical protein
VPLTRRSSNRRSCDTRQRAFASKLRRIAQLQVTLISYDHERRQVWCVLTEGVVLVIDLARVLWLLRPL